MYTVTCILAGITVIFYLSAVTLGILAVMGGIIDIVKGRRHAPD